MTSPGGAPAAPPPRAFGALHHPGFRAYFTTSALAMMADSIEHVISYWMIFQAFGSPALGGFAVISHWVPFLLLSVPVGALADHFDPRRLIQIGMVCFMVASLGWALLFLTGWLQTWHAVVLLSLHGLAGVLWGPPGQLLIHDIVGRDTLQSAVRLSATARWLGLLFGPAIGGALLVLVGPVAGLIVNVGFYLPLLLWLWRAPYGPRFRSGEAPPPRAVRGLADLLEATRAVAADPVLLSMTALTAVASFAIGNAYQAQMPGFAAALGHGDAGLLYSLLLAADAAGALAAGVALESRGLLQAKPRTALLLALVWCLALAGFAAVRSYPLALGLLFVAGFVSLAFNAMAQTLVQLHAPAAIRGRVIGLYSMAGLGLRAFSGVTIGLGGTLVGIHAALALSAAVLFLLVLALLVGGRRVPAPTGS